MDGYMHGIDKVVVACSRGGRWFLGRCVPGWTRPELIKQRQEEG